MTATTTVNVPLELDGAHRRHVVGGEPMVYHCHHYNTFLQRSIQDASFIDSTPFLVGAAAEVAYNQLRTLFASEAVTSVEDRKRLAESVYRWAGFGVVDLADLGEMGGTVPSADSHYAWSWNSKFGGSSRPVCLFASGWLAGAAAAIFDRALGAYDAAEACCGAVDGGSCRFQVREGSPSYTVFEPVGVGPLTRHGPDPLPVGRVDREGIYGAVTGMDLSGDARGCIDAFGVYLTHHYANYYNRISYELVRATQDRFGAQGREVVEPLLVEAGHVCAFNTFGGIMKSTEWDALIRPSLETPEDWVDGMVSVVNALGWGRWQVVSADPNRTVIRTCDDYESVGHLAMYGAADHPVSYLALGAVVGLVNLVYVGDIASRPELTPAFYDQLFKGREVYAGRQTRSQAMGEPCSEFTVERI